MSVELPPYLLRVYARWYPIGARFFVRFGALTDAYDVPPVLDTAGWHVFPAERLRDVASIDFPKDPELSMAFVDTRTVHRHLTPFGDAIVRSAIDRLMMEPRLWEGVTHDDYVHEDIRVGWSE